MGLRFYDYESYEPWETAKMDMEDETLLVLPGSGNRISLEESEEAYASLREASVDGVKYGADWVEINEDGTLRAQGVLSQCPVWGAEDGRTCYGALLEADEEYGSLQVANALPLVVLPETRVVLNGREVEDADGDRDALLTEDYYRYEVNARFVVREGWLEATEMEFVDADSDESWLLDSTFDYGKYSGFVSRAPESDLWIDVAKGRENELAGYIDSYIDMDGGYDYLVFAMPDAIGSAPALHFVRVKCEKGLSLGDSSEEMTLSAKLGEGGLSLL